jgi:hypothetical protein
MNDIEREEDSQAEEMLSEYDFSNGERGRYAERMSRSSTVVVLAPDVAEVFRTSDAVNKALRELIVIARNSVKASSSRS